MGFCLLKEFGEDGLFVAVNPAHVTAEAHGDVVRLSFSKDLVVDVEGELEAVNAGLLAASKIGVQKLEVGVMAKRDHFKPTPLLLHHAQRIMVVREVSPHELPADRPAEVMVMSEVTHEDGRIQYITERPGVFAMRANKCGEVPGI